MDNRNEFKKIDIEIHACYYFDYIMRVIDINSRDILLDEKKCENILIYDISYKPFIGLKPLHIRFDEIDEFIKVYDGIRYLVLFGSGFYDKIFDRIKYLISKKKWYYR